jgi:hypothetical protein
MNKSKVLTYRLNLVHHLSSIINRLENGLDCLSSVCHVFECFLGALLCLFLLLDELLSLFFVLNGLQNLVYVEDLSLDPVIHVEVRVTEAITEGLALFFEGWAGLIAAEDHFAVVVVDVCLQVEILVV